MAGLIDVVDQILGGGSKSEDRKAKRAMEEMLSGINGVEVPELQNIALDDYDYLGDLVLPATVQAGTLKSGPDVSYEDVDPRLAEIEKIARTRFEDVGTDPRLKEQQLAALNALTEIGESGGLTARDRAQLARIKGDVAAEDRGRREAIMNSMARRGMLGSGMELLAALQSNQAATERAAQAGLDVAGMAQDRALQALMNAGNLSGDIRGQEFGEQAQVASAADAIAKFNAQNQNAVNQYNTTTQNQAQQFNATNRLNTEIYNKDNQLNTQKFNIGNQLDAARTNAGYANEAAQASWLARQDAANANTDLANRQKMHNQYTVPQQNFDNRMAKAGAAGNAQAQMADYWTGIGDRKAQKQANMIASGTKAAAAAAMMASDERVKEDVSDIPPEDIHEFLSAIKPKRYRYKDPGKPGRAEGDRIGFIIQDVEDTKLGKKLVREDEDGMKYYDRDNLDGIILAALSELERGK